MVDCDTAQLLGPDQISTDALTGDPQDVSLDALVMVNVAEGASIASIAEPTERAAAEQALFASIREKLQVGTQSYEALDVALRYDDYALLQPLNEDGTPRTRTTNAQEIIDLAKAQLGGARPADIDVVYVATDLDIQLPDLGNAVAGLADCIGGVRYAHRAFSFSEGTGQYARNGDLTGLIAAHEIGHLMGAHHHYGNCGEGMPLMQRGGPTVCTVMFPLFIRLNAGNFGTLEGAVVRGHATAYAAP